MGNVLKVLNSEELKILRDDIELFANDIMQSYLEKCKNNCKNCVLSPNNTKNFYDSVWGTIEINEGEILILDSPILQRLRKIKQLGLANLLYSSADHSRFSHTLGVLQTADVMSHQIARELAKNDVSTDLSTFQIIRLAAIFHDCGHMFCSHASERYFQKNRNAKLYPTIQKVKTKFKETLSINPSLSEIISILIVNSSSVRELINTVQQGLNTIVFNSYKADEVIEKICCLIIGFPYSEKMISYAKVICGQIDSDKLDYLRRDSHATGVPVAVDMSRIFQKLRVVSSDKQRGMIATTEEKADAVYNLAIAPAAINTIDQLVISRYMMFENIYYHQKTLTAEETLRYAMLKLDFSTVGLLDQISNVLRITDDIIIHPNFKKAIKSIVPSFKISETPLPLFDKDSDVLFEEACDILCDLNQRRLFKRCVVFTDKNMTSVQQSEQNFYDRIIVANVITDRDKFVQLVTEETINIKNRLARIYSFNERTDILFLSAPDISSTSLNSNIAIANSKNKDRNMFFESDRWLESRAARKPQNYLVSYTEDRYIVYIATELVLLRDYGMLINDNIIFTEEDELSISRLKEQLDKEGYFNNFYLLSPDADIDIYEAQMSELLEKWKHYELFDTTAERGIPLNLAYFKLHIKQFKQFQSVGDFSVFIRLYLKMLQEMQIISKDTIINTLLENFKKIQKNENCSWEGIEVCNIGNYQDGSSQIAYHMNIVNLVLKNKFIAKDLQKVLLSASGNQIIVFLEDAFCSGKQILSVFETYMGIPKNERQTQEIHVDELSSEQKERLKKCNLYFSFIFYEKENEDFFYRRMGEIGLKNVHIIAKSTFSEGYFINKDNESMPGIQILKAYLEAAGQMLINHKAYANGKLKSGWNETRIHNSFLGYNDAQQLITFTWNTPTYTLTPLWMRMNTSDFKWIPLFPRIDK